MTQNSLEHFQMLALGTAVGVAFVMFVASYAFFKTKRRPRLYYGGGMGLIVTCMAVSLRFSFALCGVLLLTTHVAHADQKAVELLNKVQNATEAAKTLTADFTDTIVTPTDTENITSHMMGTLRLMKPNYADISLTASIDGVSHFREHIVSDGTMVWTYTPATNLYTKRAADPEGKNINVWQLIIIGGFFSVPTWLHRGLYTDDPNELTYAGRETVNGIEYQVLEHKLTRSIHDKPCPLDQKLYIGADNLIHRFTLCLTQDGKSKSEVAELTNIKVGQTMLPSEFTFAIPAEAQERKPRQ